MPKTKDQKTAILDQLRDRLARKKAIILMNYQGLKVEETDKLKKKLRNQKIDYGVAKNSLFKIILNEKGIQVSSDILVQPLALGFAYDEVVVSKEISLFAKEHEALKILGGILDQSFVSAEIIEALAKLPSREELLAKMVGSLNAPLSGLVNVLVGNIRGLISVLNQVKEQRIS